MLQPPTRGVERDCALCSRCGSPMELVTRVPPFGGEPALPALLAFECMACHAVDSKLEEPEQVFH